MAKANIDVYDVWVGEDADLKLIYSGPNRSEARRTFVRTAILDEQGHACAMTMGQRIEYPAGLELRGVSRRGKTLTSLKAADLDPMTMRRLYKEWNYVETGSRRYGIR